MPILLGTSIQIIYLGVVHKLHTLVMQNMQTIGKYRDMSRIYIALQGLVTSQKTTSVFVLDNFLLNSGWMPVRYFTTNPATTFYASQECSVYSQLVATVHYSYSILPGPWSRGGRRPETATNLEQGVTNLTAFLFTFRKKCCLSSGVGFQRFSTYAMTQPRTYIYIFVGVSFWIGPWFMLQLMAGSPGKWGKSMEHDRNSVRDIWKRNRSSSFSNPLPYLFHDLYFY